MEYKWPKTHIYMFNSTNNQGNETKIQFLPTIREKTWRFIISSVDKNVGNRSVATSNRESYSILYWGIVLQQGPITILL